MNGLLKVICLIAVISLCPGVFPAGSVQAAMPTVTYLESFGVGTQMAGPGAMDLDDGGNLYIADSDAGVLKFNKFGTLVGQFNSVPVSGGGLAVSADGSRVYVSGDTDADLRRDQVAILDAETGAILGYLGQGAGEFGNAGEIDHDSTGVIYVLDSTNKTLRSYIDDGVGNALAGDSFSVDVAGRLCALSAMAINTVTDEIFVADKKDPAEVRVYSTQGGLLATYAAASHFGAQMSSFRGIAFDSSDRGYFIDNVNAKIAVLDFANASGSTLASPMGIIDLGAVATGAQMPQDVVVDSFNRLFVAGSFADGPSAAVVAMGDIQLPANTPPPTPSILSPQGGVVTASPVALAYSSVTDEDGDAVTYQVTADCGGTITGNSLPLGAADENATCNWQVSACDATECSAPATASFAVNLTPETPSAPTGLLPADATAGVTGVSQFVWDAATDADPNETFTYQVLLTAPGAAAVVAGPVASGVELDALAAQAGVEMAPGISYSWQVVAVDSTGLEATSGAQTFTYANGLVIDSNVPGADVYLGGNPGYPGELVGQTPYTQIGADAGDYQVAVVHPGFEPVYGIVTMVDGRSERFFADFVPAVQPEKHFVKSSGLAEKTISRPKPIRRNGLLMPFLADFDNDGNLDLLLGKANSGLALFPGLRVNAKGNLRFQEKEMLVQLPETDLAPVVVDWNNDNLPDIIYGSVDGLVRLVLNSGKEGVPFYDGSTATQLTEGVTPISSGGFSAPFVADWNGDGKKDLVVGGDLGIVSLYLNTGTAAAPVLELSGALYAAPNRKRVVPFVSDWDADGDLDLIIMKSGRIFVVANDTGVLAAPVRVQVLAENRKDAAALQVGGGLFVVDADDRKGKDILVADSTGQLAFVKSRGAELAPTFFNVLDNKLVQIADMVTKGLNDPEPLLAMVYDAQASLTKEGLNLLPGKVAELKAAQNLPVDAVGTCDELLLILQ